MVCSVARALVQFGSVECASPFKRRPGAFDNLRRRVVVDVDAIQPLRIPAIRGTMRFELATMHVACAPYFNPDAHSYGTEDS